MKCFYCHGRGQLFLFDGEAVFDEPWCPMCDGTGLSWLGRKIFWWRVRNAKG